MLRFFFATCLATTCIGTAQAQELRPFCADRPGLGTPACTVDRDHLVVELGGVDWTLDQDDASRTDTLTAGDLLLRYGVSDKMELQLGWTAFGTVRTRDKVAGGIGRMSGVGDLTLAARYNLSNPDGSGFSAAVMPHASIPVGGAAVGAGDWGAGVIIPLSYSLDDRFGLSLSPSLDAAVDSDRHGRHLNYGAVIGLSATLTDSVNGTAELGVTRDDDPDGHSTEALGSLSLAWQPNDNLQFDIGAVAGLNRSSPDVELYIGIARRF